jgi:hypothetical protein
LTVADAGDCTCGGKIPASRGDGFCSSWCAGRDAQGLPPQTPPARFPSPAAVLSVAPAPPPAAAVLSVEQRTRAALEDAGVGDGWEAAAALNIAAAIDGGASGTALAALHRELRAAMGSALQGTAGSDSRVQRARDEVRARRERRSGGAG